ncbi:hypothetical protein BGZ51_003511 [Haplosporangium sp. Z 767]|nr:hypothetical protein BGZ51_003511 [Haplosporangium sp. Z 767]KAF9184902.1 hypothetical protein BGZ50_003398 [Haplosporangium sp. Z 11]
MIAPIFKLLVSTTVLACAVQALPLEPQCVGGECVKSMNAGKVDIGSTTRITPVSEITPITRIQPIIQSYMPIVQAEGGCPQADKTDPALFGLNIGRPETRAELPDAAIINSGTINRFFKRNYLKPDCVPSATVACEQTVELESGTTDMGSIVTATPSNVILSSTVYQNKVQSESPEVFAAVAQYADLKKSNVILGSQTRIQPVHKVLPKTTYRPSVKNKPTIVEMTAPEYESLARSSVSLGSSVTIRPVTTVEPLTIFQQKIKSFPFVINDAGCETTSLRLHTRGTRVTTPTIEKLKQAGIQAEAEAEAEEKVEGGFS